MGKISEENIISFTIEFINKVCEINEKLILGDYFMRFGKTKLLFDCIIHYTLVEDWTAEDFLETFDSYEEIDVKEFKGDDECVVAYLYCEGYLYEKLWGYQAFGGDIFGDGDEAKRLYYAINEISEKYGIWYGLHNEGALTFYEYED